MQSNLFVVSWELICDISIKRNLVKSGKGSCAQVRYDIVPLFSIPDSTKLTGSPYRELHF